MHIAVDLRSLSSGSVSGVENYIVNLLERLLVLDRKNHYTLFYNSWRTGLGWDFSYINAKTKRTKIPNKLLNLAFKANAVSLERLIGPFDCLFLPNLNQYHIGKNTKLILTVHDLSPVVAPENYDFKRRLWHTFLNYGQAFGRADLIFTVSDYTRNDLLRLYGIDGAKVKTVYPGIDHKTFNPDISQDDLRYARNRYGLPGEYLLFLNTIEPRKNLVNVVKAFETINHPASLVIAGRKGWKYRDIFRQIRKSRKADKIKYLGYVKEHDKPAIIRMAKILVYPSVYEGFGFQPLEAMACGTPTAVAQVTALPEVVKDASLLVNPYDINSISEALNSLLADSNLSEMLVKKGLERSKAFSWDASAKKILDSINSL